MSVSPARGGEGPVGVAIAVGGARCPDGFQIEEIDTRVRSNGLPEARIVDVMEELVKVTVLTRGVSDQLTDRYSERKESGRALIDRVNASRAG